MQGLGVVLTVKLQVVCSHEKLETKLDGNVHVRDVLSVAILVPVVEVLNNLLEDLTTKKFVRLCKSWHWPD
jgi:hypothetical protein